MKRPRTFYGWVEGETRDGVRSDTFKVSVFSGADRRGANSYGSKEAAEADVKSRKDQGQPTPKIEWENENG